MRIAPTRFGLWNTTVAFTTRSGAIPGAINYDQLNIAKSELRNDVLEALGKNYRTPNHFPAREEDEWSIGRVVVLTKKTHPDFFSQLRVFAEAEFELEPATRSSVAPKLTSPQPKRRGAAPTAPNSLRTCRTPSLAWRTCG